MNSKHVSQGRRAIILSFLFLIMLGIPIGLQSGFAKEAPFQESQSAHSASPGSGQPLPPTQITESRISNPAAPSFCYQIAFSNYSYVAGFGLFGVAIGNFNGDGELDLAAANYYSNSVSILLGIGNGSFTKPNSYPAGTKPHSVVVADLFSDRIDDLVVVNATTTGVSYLQGGGDGTFFPPYYFDMGYEPYSVAAGDFNNDTWPDLVTVSSTANKISIRLNDGEGDFAPATHIAVSSTPYSVTIGDLNGDGKPDLVTANYASNDVSVLLGNGNGTFQAPINFGTGDAPRDVAIGDLNGDGIPDMATANFISSSISVLRGNGNGTFQDAVSFGAGNSPVDVAIGDFNDDGKPDLVSANHSTNNLSVLVSNGDGSFQPAVNFALDIDSTSVVVGDFNNDGKPDLATANFASSKVMVLLNTCVSLTNTPTPPVVPTSTNTSTSTATDTFTPLPTQTPGGPTATPPPLPTTCAIQFTDVAADNTFYPFVRCLACRGIISGYACGGSGEPCNPANDPYFRPSSPVTRGQLAKIVSNSAGFSDPVSGQTFEDVVPGSAFYMFVERLVSREVMGGYACGGVGEPCGSGNLPYFRPGSGATRGQLTKIVSNAAGFTDPAPGTFTFTDVGVGSTFHVYVERLLMNRPGVMGGYDCGGVGEPCDPQNRAYFRPANPLTRGQTSKIVGNAFFPDCQTPAEMVVGSR